jgi:hypothetical protein
MSRPGDSASQRAAEARRISPEATPVSLHDLPIRPARRQLWHAIREEVSEVAWLLATVGGLSAAAVSLAVLLALLARA